MYDTSCCESFSYNSMAHRVLLLHIIFVYFYIQIKSSVLLCTYTRHYNITCFSEQSLLILISDPVPQPKVSCTGAGNNLTLTCSVDSLVEAKFKWTGPNQFSHVGNTVHISREQNEAIYFCTAENEVSSKYMEFNLMDCPASGNPFFVCLFVCL